MAILTTHRLSLPPVRNNWIARQSNALPPAGMRSGTTNFKSTRSRVTIRLAQLAIPCALLAASRCFAADVALSGGLNSEAVIVGVDTQWMAAAPLRVEPAWALRYGVEFDALNIHARQARKYGASNIAAIGVTPMLRIEWPRGDHLTFVDAGVGAHLLSHTSLQGGPNFGTAFQFGEWIGTGLRFGPGMAYEVGLRLEHLSNADIKLPNDGITFASLRAAWHF
jgi:lipid A 3-O-deacylase